MNLDFLNDSQRQAVLETDGPVMILAGAGSGKTRTLVARIQYLLEEKGASPYQVLAVTFSNKAAREMRERLAASTDINVGTLQVTTFHAFCARVLRMEATYLGLSKNFTIYDDGESNSIIKAILNRRGINQKELSPYTISAYIDGLKNLGYYVGLAKNEDVAKYAEDKRLFDIFLEYEAELHRSNAVDFGGLITGVLNLFKSFPEVLKKYQQKYKYVLVDEYQDTNRAQFDLIQQLSEAHRNVCVVGDEDQSIYSWRGADIRNILDYETVFPEAKLIKLEQNYRSSKKIIEAASEVISRNVARKGKNMWTNNDEGEEIQIVECRDDKAEAEYIAQQIKKLSQNDVPLKDIAVFYRNNAHSRTIEDALRKEKFPYRVVAGIKFYDRKEVKDMISYMRIVVNKKDSLALTRVINTPARGVGTTSLRKLEDEAVRLQLSLFELLEKIVESPSDFKHLSLSGKVQSSIYQFVQLIQEVQVLESQNNSPSFSYEKLLNESGYYDFLRADKSYEGAARLENLEELMSAIKQYEDSEEAPSMVKYLENITLDTTSDEAGGDQISLMTVHGSKGLEYPYVFLIGIEENIFPSYKSLETGPVALEEERRLFYVAMTRAMKQLTITFAQGRMLWGSIKFNGPSQFLHEIPSHYYKWNFHQTGSKKSEFSGSSNSWDDFDQTSHSYDDEVYYKDKVYQQKKSVTNSAYPAGSKIIHALYGDGTVIDSEGFGQDEKVTIQFREGIKKKFMVKFAPLQRV